MSKKIMIADDSVSMRLFVTQSLMDLDLEMVEAANGQEALKALTQHQFDLMILDVNMPEINGLEVLCFVKQHQFYKNIRTIIISTDHGEADIKKGLELGADQYLIKPFQMNELADIVCELLSI